MYSFVFLVDGKFILNVYFILFYFLSSFQETILVTQLVRETTTVMQEFTQSVYSHAPKNTFPPKNKKEQKKRKK